MHGACDRARVCVHIHRTHPPSTDVFAENILIFCRRALAAFGINRSSRRPKSRADNKRESNRAFKLRATPSLFQSENQSQYTTQENRKIAAAKHATPRKRENPQRSQYSKPTLKTETRKKIEKRAKIKELETRRQRTKKQKTKRHTSVILAH